MPNSLGPWEPDAEHPTTEVRRTRAGTLVVSLGPEGLPGSQCWAWVVHTARDLPQRVGVTLGSDGWRDVARAQADAAVMAFGYEPDGLPRNAPQIARRIINLPLSGAAALAQQAGVQFRVGTQDGRVRLLTDDYRTDRVTVTVMDGIVTEARIG